jgi:hypothetical protein
MGGNNNESESQSKISRVGGRPLPWTGEPFQPSDIDLVGQRSIPLIVGMVGCADAGKTCYLGMMYTLLFNGKKFARWGFAGSYTLSAWETLAQYLRIKADGTVEFPPPTPSSPDFYSFYHMALRRGELFRDILFADSSGEVFKLWTENTDDPNAANARWIYEKSSAFIFMIDCVALKKRRGAAKLETVQMAEQLAANLENRPVAIVWSKADEIENIRETIRTALEDDLARVFKNSSVIRVSSFPKSDPDVLCHKNNLAVVEYLLEELNKPRMIQIDVQAGMSPDTFLDYKGPYGSE